MTPYLPQKQHFSIVLCITLIFEETLLKNTSTLENHHKNCTRFGNVRKFFNLVQGFFIENDNRSNGTSRAAQYGSAPPLGKVGGKVEEGLLAGLLSKGVEKLSLELESRCLGNDPVAVGLGK